MSPLALLAVFVAALVPIVMARAWWPTLLAEILRDLRVPRVLHYVAVSGMGMALHVRTSPRADAPQLLATWLAFSIALTYAAVFAIVTNNLEDLEADRISNPGRPLVRGSVRPRAYLLAGGACLLVSLVLAAAVGPHALAGIVGVTLGYAAYSCRPLRLKRVPILAKGMLGLNALIVAVTGFCMAGGAWRDFPTSWAACMLLPMSLAANFVDLKDVEGDRATGVLTLPILVGQAPARFIIGVATLVTYVWAAILVGLAWLPAVCAVLAVVHVALLYRRPYREGPVFLVYVSGFFALDLFLLL